jgi:hypothetical protein
MSGGRCEIISRTRGGNTWWRQDSRGDRTLLEANPFQYENPIRTQSKALKARLGDVE